MIFDKNTEVTALWLSTGKKLPTDLGLVLTGNGALVRTEAKKALIIPPSHIVAVEVTYEDSRELDEAMNGQSGPKA